MAQMASRGWNLRICSAAEACAEAGMVADIGLFYEHVRVQSCVLASATAVYAWLYACVVSHVTFRSHAAV